MISDATVDRFYYIFDSREQRAVVLDRTTGEEVPWTSLPRVQLITYVGEQQSVDHMRAFARRCAQQTRGEADESASPAGRLWTAVQDGDEPWTEVREDLADEVVRAAALGLPRREADAARLLTVHACTHPDPLWAAVDAAHMSERWAEFSADPHPQQAVRRLRQRQVDWLLDAL